MASMQDRPGGNASATDLAAPTDLPRIGPATMPGPYLAQILNELRAARTQVEYAWDLCMVAEPSLEQHLGARTAATLDNYCAAAYHELDEALDLIDPSRKLAS